MRPLLLAPWFALWIGCASSPPPEPKAQAEAEEPSRADDPTSSPEPAGAPAPGQLVRTEATPDTEAPARPSSYEITNRDCDALGDKLAEVTRADQSAEISPKLTKAQREQTEAASAEVARKVGERWAESCRRSLVGGFADAGSLKCAMRAKTVKAFDDCLNAAPKADAP